MSTYSLVYDEQTGALAGAVRDGVTYVPRTAPAWADVVAWAAAQVPPVDLNDRAPPTEAERVAATRAAALTGLLTRADDIGIAVRATVAAITFLINERLQHFNAQIVALSGAAYPEPVRVLQADVLAYLMANPTAGDPAT